MLIEQSNQILRNSQILLEIKQLIYNIYSRFCLLFTFYKMSDKEAKARVKIDKLLEASWWRFFDEWDKKATIALETHMKEMWDNYEKVKNGFADYLLLDENQFPICVLEAKREELDPLVWKEQARWYAIAQKCRFVILSNWNIHYFWDMEKWNPGKIFRIPTLEELQQQKSTNPEPQKIVDMNIDFDFVARSQDVHFDDDPRWNDISKRWEYVNEKWLRLLRPYQINAIKAVQKAVSEWKNRFLREMATWTWKTLTAAAIIKLFLKSKQANRVLFLVDRLELEVQAKNDFITYLGNDYTTVVYKENRDDWRKAAIVVTTIQSISHNNKYLNKFTPSDFDLIISDEAHRSISWSNRAIFEYFLWYKLWLTATPKDYLKNLDKKKVSSEDPREVERRELLSTYATFWCESGEPTFRYSLLDWVKDWFLVNPITLDCRTEITTELLSEEWYAVFQDNEEWWEDEVIYNWRNFEKTFFSEETNLSFCKAFLENAERDPISWEIGKTIFFCVSRKHATKITQILNELADKMFPWKYNSDFAIQVTSDIPDAQQFTINFSNDNLLWHTKFLEWYTSSKARVCVTVWMMTTWYNCTNILNLCLARPIFSPSDFVQIKWRWTRKFTFSYDFKVWADKLHKQADKTHFKLFDFFANCEYFEEKYPYDEVLKLPKVRKWWWQTPPPPPPPPKNWYESEIFDPMKEIKSMVIDENWMRIDRELYTSNFEKTVREHFNNSEEFKEAVNNWNYEIMENYIKSNIFDRPDNYFNIKKLREWYQGKTDRILWLWEILDLIFWKIDRFKTKDDIAQEEFDKFMLNNQLVDQSKFYPAKEFFKSYLSNQNFRLNVDEKKFREYADQPEIYWIFKSLWTPTMNSIIKYIRDNVNQKDFN